MLDINRDQLNNPAYLQRAGIEALEAALGVVGTVRFLQQIEYGYGDYTKERERLLDGDTIDDIKALLATR